MSREHSCEQPLPLAAAEAPLEMLRPTIDADVESIGDPDGLRTTSAIFPDVIEERGPPLVAREEAVKVAAERTAAAPADLGADLEHEGLAIFRGGVAAPV